MLYNDDQLKEILDKTDLVALIGQSVTLKANGKRWWGLCPFHGEKSPSFTVNPANQFFYCFGCQEKGNAFGFLMKHEHLSFPEAVKKLAAQAGVTLGEPEEQTPQDKERHALHELLGRLAGTFAHLLSNHPEAAGARNLLASRGVSPEMIERFQLGYALREWGWMKRFLTEKKYSADFLPKTGLFSTNNPDAFLFGGRLVFPIKANANETVGFGGRLLGNDTGPKYINSPETSVFLKRRMLYAWDQALASIREKQQAILCEGYMDAIALHQAGLTWAVAPLGTSFTEDQALLLKKYCRSVICIFDSDAAGQKATAKVIEICEPLELNTFVATTPGSKDPSELLENHGPEAVQHLLEEPKKGFDFLLQYRYTAYQRQSHFDLRGFLVEMFAFLSKVGNGTLRETFLNSMADFLGVARETLLEDFQKGDSKGTDRALTAKSSATMTPTSSVGGRTLEWMLLMAVVTQPVLYRRLRRDISPDAFAERRAKELFEVLEMMAGDASVPDFPLEDVLSRASGATWKDDLVRDIMSGEFDGNADQQLEDGLNFLRKRTLVQQRKRVGERLVQVAGDIEATEQIMQEILFLDREITRIKGKV